MCMSNTSTRQHLAIPDGVNVCIPLTGISLLHPANTANHHRQVERIIDLNSLFFQKHTSQKPVCASYVDGYHKFVKFE